MGKPLSRAAQIETVLEALRSQVEDKSICFYEDNGQFLFPIWAPSGGLAPTFALYAHYRNEDIPDESGEIRINFSDPDEVIIQKVKAGFAKFRKEIVHAT
jgi:hypothetical protein